MIIRKLIFWISISVLIFWILFPLILSVLSLEFADSILERSFDEIRFWGIPICILLTLFGINKKNQVLQRIILTIGAAFFAFFIMIISVFADMCDWSKGNPLFTNNKTEEIKIISRDYGCGATDSSPPIVDTFLVQPRFKYFILSKKININQIDSSEWTKIE